MQASDHVVIRVAHIVRDVEEVPRPWCAQGLGCEELRGAIAGVRSGWVDRCALSGPACVPRVACACSRCARWPRRARSRRCTGPSALSASLRFSTIRKTHKCYTEDKRVVLTRGVLVHVLLKATRRLHQDSVPVELHVRSNYLAHIL